MAKKRTTYMTYYLFFVLGLVVGNIVSMSVFRTVVVLTIASMITALTIVNTYRLDMLVERERQRAQLAQEIVAPLRTPQSIGILDEYCWKSGHKGGWTCADCHNEGKA